MNSVITQAESHGAAILHAIGRLRQTFQVVLHALRFRLGAAARAHERRRTLEAVGEHTMRDLGVPPETATGLASWQADLPFFMQSGFSRR